MIRYLQKATQLDRMLGPAWLAYGHSFAVENEHDQAMAAYFKVSTQKKYSCWNHSHTEYSPDLGLSTDEGMSLTSSLHWP